MKREKKALITVERYTGTSGQTVTLTEAYDGTHEVIYQRKMMTFCVEDFDREQEQNENCCRRAHAVK
jgi:hypothetical protein